MLSICLMLAATGMSVVPSPARATPDREPPPLFATLTADRTPLYINEFFDLTLSIYVRDANLDRNIQQGGWPPSTQLQLASYQNLPIENQTVQGKTYEVRRFRFPARAPVAGPLTIALQLQGTVVISARFFFQEMRTARIPIEPLALNILPLPTQGRTSAFSGIIGRDLSFSAQANPTDLALGDLVTLTLAIEGAATWSGAMPPQAALEPGCKSYPARQVAAVEGAKGRLVFEQVIIPLNNTVRHIGPVSFNYFDTRFESYVTLTQGPFPLTFHAERAAMAPAYSPTGTVSAASATKAPMHLKPSPGHWRPASLRPWYLEQRVMALQLIPPAGLLLIVLWRRRRNRRQSARDRQAAATRRCEELQQKMKAALENRAAPEFYTAAEELLAWTLSPPQAHASSSTVPSLRMQLARSGLPDTQLASLQALLATGEQVRYGSGSTGARLATDELAQRMQADYELVMSKVDTHRTDRRASGWRRWFLVLLLGLGLRPAPTRAAEEPEALFQAAGQAYAAGETRNAIDLYTRLLVQQYTAPELFHNLGLACLEAGQPERAILNLRRAWYLDPRDPSIQTALDAALQTAHLPPDPPDPLARCFTPLSLGEWAAVAIGAYWLFFLAIGLALLQQKLSRWWVGMAGAMVLVMLLAAAGIGHWTRRYAGREAVVTSTNAMARIAPAPGARVLVMMPPGALVTPLATHGEWIKVRWRDRAGWLPASAMEKVF